MATGDQTLINFPRESTMKEISQALQTMAFTQAANLENISTWDQIRFPSPIGELHFSI